MSPANIFSLVNICGCNWELNNIVEHGVGSNFRLSLKYMLGTNTLAYFAWTSKIRKDSIWHLNWQTLNGAKHSSLFWRRIKDKEKKVFEWGLCCKTLQIHNVQKMNIIGCYLVSLLLSDTFTDYQKHTSLLHNQSIFRRLQIYNVV